VSNSADAVAREVAFLTASGDGLPALLKSDGGPWSVVQAYWPRTPLARQSGVYLMRSSLLGVRWANQRRIETHDFRGKLCWPIGSTTTSVGIWEVEQAAFDSAIALLTQRIYGYMFDHTHGARFLSVAEAPEPGRVLVHFDDPEHSNSQSPAMLTATISYSADDNEIII
jgi:hypothetical protein